MKFYNLIRSEILLICFSLITGIHANGQINKQLPMPIIKAGIANISGSISNLKLPENEKKVSISFFISNPISGEESNYTTSLNASNRFNINIPIECNTALVNFRVESETLQYGYGSVIVHQDLKLCLNIVFDKQGNMKLSTKGGVSLSTSDLMNIPKAIERFEKHVTYGNYYKMTPKEFSDYEINVNLKKRISFAIDSLPLSDKIKKMLANSFNLRYLQGRLFCYKDCVEKSHLSAKDSSAFTAVEPDKSYYSFLKGFNLNDPQLLYSYTYGQFMRNLLMLEALNIPLIKDTPIEEWLTEVKSSIKDIVGFDKGFFYDMLVVNAYTLQMNYKVDPLSKKQIENIHNYFNSRNKEIVSILLKTNNEVVKKLDESNDLKINNSLSVSKEKLMEAIVSKYKGKVVLVDFWATWCGPCLRGIKDMKSLKSRLKDKEIVFVYIASESSPRTKWESEIKAIGGEQYYLATSESNYISDHYGFEGIPSYLIFDKNGVMKHKFTGFPGVNKMGELLDELLK